jgi:hypothetical protein
MDSLSTPLDEKDFDTMSGEDLAEFRTHLLKTVIYSVKILTFNDPACLAGNGPKYFDKIFDGEILKPTPTKNGTLLLFTKSFLVNHAQRPPCKSKSLNSVIDESKEFTIYSYWVVVLLKLVYNSFLDSGHSSTVLQVLRTALLPNKEPGWFFTNWWFGGDKTMIPEERCVMENRLVDTLTHRSIPKTLISTLFCY